MRIALTTRRRKCQGYALLLTMGFLAVTLIACASVMFWASTNANQTKRNNQFTTSEIAAESAVEKVLAQMDRDFVQQSLSNSSSYATLLPTMNAAGNVWPIQYTFSDTNSTNGQISVNFGTASTNTVPLNSQYTGLYGLVQPVTITATATPIGQFYNVPATVSEQLQFASIPLFQFAIFYNMNLEINAAATLNINGPVFCNQSIWTGANITYSNTVAAVGQVYQTAPDPFAHYTNSGSASVFKMPGQPTMNANQLSMPIGTNNDPNAVRAILNLPPSAYASQTAAAYSTNGLIYLANAVDLYITNSASGISASAPTGTNTLIYFQDATASPNYWAFVTNDFYTLYTPAGRTTNYVSTNRLTGIDCVTNVKYASYSFITNVTFVDWREGWNGGSGPAKTVQALQIDIAKFNLWLTNNIASANGGYNYNSKCNTDKGHPIDSIYVYNNVTPSSSTLPAVRVVNGQQLYDLHGLTIVTPFPMYVKGNYNIQQTSGGSQSFGVNSTTYTRPAGFLADAITILSGNWSDSTTSKKPTATNTTINAACLEGIVPSDLTLSGDPSYSGGVENFLRLLENWGSATVTYNGSIVVMFSSQYATNRWQQTGNYYGAPTRHWAFDQNFTQQGGLPPLAPQSKAVIRGQWLGF